MAIIAINSNRCAVQCMAIIAMCGPTIANCR